MKNSIKSAQKGFTLVELMVVIAIIGILSAIILANFTTARSKSRDGQRISDISQIQYALAAYFNQCNVYPSTTTLPTTLPETDTGCPTNVNLSTFISKIPTPPIGTGQTTYSYSTGTEGGTIIDYVLEATLENNSSVSTESLSAFPTTSGITYSPTFTCDSTIHYCLGPK